MNLASKAEINAARNPLATLGLAITLVFTAHTAVAQTESGWSNQGLIYLLGPTLDGTSGVGPFDTDVDLSAGDVFDNLDSAFLGMYRGEGQHWGVLVDIVYMDLKADGSGDRGALSGEVELEQTTAIVSATYRLSPTTQLMAGALYNDIAGSISLTGPIGTSGTSSRSCATTKSYSLSNGIRLVLSRHPTDAGPTQDRLSPAP